MKFELKLGRLVMTSGIARKITSDKDFQDFVNASFGRYIKGDWGDLSDEDKNANEEAVKCGDLRILAAYINPKTKEKIWIITEANRSYTTILFPEEY